MLLGIFVLFDIALFGYLIVNSLSKREVARVLSETRVEAESLAERIAGQVDSVEGDLVSAVASEQETQSYIDSVLVQRDIVRTVEIRDREGRVVFRGQEQITLPGEDGGLLGLELQELPPQVEEQTFGQETSFDVRVPIGDLGEIYIGLSGSEIERRVEVLREDLIRQTSVTGGVTLVVLVLASLVIWWLLRRGRLLEDQAVEAERLAYVGTLASGLAHEIRNPLNSLNLNMQMLEEEAESVPTTGSSRRLLSITRSEISRLERLVTDFLSYGRPRRMELETLPAGRFLERALEVLAGEIQGHGAEVSIEDRTEGHEVTVDRGQIDQVLLNLTQNALAATEEIDRRPEIRLAADRQGEHLVLSVEDNGMGIEPEELGQVFDLFYSTRKGGTGLGLAIAQRIASTHGGSLEIVSEPGQGTVARLILPTEVPSSARRNAVPAVRA